MTVLLYSYGIIIDCAINALGHGNDFVDGINATKKLYLNGKWNLLLNYQVTIPQILGCFPLLKKMSPLNL